MHLFTFCPQLFRAWPLGLALVLAGPARAQGPALLSRAPAPNTNAAPAAGPVTATFSQPLSPATLGGVRVHGSRRQGQRAGTATASGSTLSFQPALPFLPGEEASVSLPASVQGTGGAIAPQVYTFRAATGGSGQGKYAAGATTAVGAVLQSRDNLLGDLDNDGDVDVLSDEYIGPGIPNQLRVLRNQAGTLVPEAAATLPLYASFPPNTPLTDFDGDGDLDVLLTRLTYGHPDADYSIFFNDGTGNFMSIPSRSLWHNPFGYNALVADVDADGDQDLLVPEYNFSSNDATLRTFLNDGSANFTQLGTGVLVGDVNGLVVGDVDEDGDVDVLTYERGSTTNPIILCRNQGSGVFAAGVATSLANTAPTSFSFTPDYLLDLNGDRHLDLVCTRRSIPIGLSLELTVSLGNGAGDFGAPTVLPAAFGTFGDVDGDGDLDCVYNDKNHENLTTALNDGQAHFTPTFTLATTYRGLDELADMDGDGDLDMPTVLYTPGNRPEVELFLNQTARPIVSGFSPAEGVAGSSITITGDNLVGTSSVQLGGLALPITASTPTSVTATLPPGAATGPLVVANSYGPGASASSFVVRLGVVSTSPVANTSSVGANSPLTATFTEAVAGGTIGGISVTGNVRGSFGTTVAGGGSSTLTLSLSMAPVAGEQLTVTLPASVQTPAGAALIPYSYSFRSGVGGTGTGDFQPSATIMSSSNGPKHVLAADLNHDGRPDLLALQPDAPNENVLVSLNAGTSTGAMLAPTLVPVASNSWALAVADINGDGHLDLLTTSRNNNTSQGWLSLRLGDGTGGFGAATNRQVGITPMALAVGDVNHDGRPDVLVADYTTGVLRTYLNGPGGLGLSPFSSVSVDPGPTDLVLADVNGDGHLDALTPAYFYFGTPGRASVRLGNGQGTFVGTGWAAVAQHSSALALGDLNGDQQPDLVSVSNTIGGAGTNALQVSFNAGGTFTPGQSMVLTGQPTQASLGDVDADGDLDVVVANAGSIQPTVLLNNGGTLTLQPTGVSGTAPQGIALADLDQDGDLDLAAANYGQGRLTVYLNMPGTLPPPTISGFTPGSGGPGTTVTVTGTRFTGATEVTVNGQAGFFLTVVSPTQLTFIVPAGATSGPIAVTTPSGTATSAGTFTVLPAPAISSFSPSSGPVGTVVTFTGSHFTGISEVSFNGTPALAFTVDSDTQLTATVPAGATTGFVMATGPGGSASGPQAFVLTGVAPSISFFSPNSGPVGTVVDVNGSGFTGATAVTFNGVNAAGFTVVSDGRLTATVPAGAGTGPVRVSNPSGQGSGPYNFTLNTPANDQCTAPGLPVLACGAAPLTGTTVGAGSTGDPATGGSGLTPSAPAGGVFYQLEGHNEAVTVSLCSSTFAAWGARLFVYSGSCGALSFVAADGGSCPSGYPRVSFMAQAGSTYYLYVNGASSSQGQFRISASCDLVVSATSIIPAGTYQNLTITGQGQGTLGGPVAVQSQLQLQAGGTLLTNCQSLSGPGSFVLGSGATLGICDANGLGLPGSGLGAVQLTGARTLSPAARYLYNGNGPQVSGAGLPAQAQALILQNPAGLALSAPLSLAQLLRLSSGDLSLNGQALTLLSGPAGTALIDNTGGVVLGATGHMQRWLDPAANPGPGYRHFSAPVSGCRVQDLAAPGYAPLVNPAYNGSATPGSVAPFPTFFGYDESRLGTSPATAYSDFDKGWVSPASPAALLTPGRGYTAHLPASVLSSFSGTFNNGPLTLALSRGPQADAGWQLLGNPYPAPIDWDAPGGIGRSQVDNALYVFQSSGPYAGQYRAYVNGIGAAGANLLAAGQGFFVRVSEGQTQGSLSFSNAARLIDFAPGQPAPARQPAANRRPLLALRLASSSGPAPADETYLYLEAGATIGFDAAFDAHKLPNPGSISLATELGGVRYAVNGLPGAGSPAAIPLGLEVPRPGTYTLTATQLLNFGTGQTVVLRDALLNTRTVLQAGRSYSCTLAGTTAPGRFWLELAPAGVLAATAAPGRAALQVFPNPSHTGRLRVQLPLAAALPADRPCAAELRNALGQLVRTYALRRPSQLWLDEELDVRGLAAGVYQLQLSIGSQHLTHRVVLH